MVQHKIKAPNKKKLYPKTHYLKKKNPLEFPKNQIQLQDNVSLAKDLVPSH